MIVANLQSIFTGDATKFDVTAKGVEAKQKAIDGTITTATVDADTKAALDGMDKVEAAGKKLASAETVAKVDADITAAQSDVDKITAELDVLRQSDVTPQVTADTSKAEAALAKAESSLSALRGARATMVVEADTSKAEGDLDGLADKAAAAGTSGGEQAGKNLGAGIVAAIATVPIAGAVVGIITAVSDSILEGLDGEVNADALAARTGLDEATVARLGRAAGEAYAGNFGESIEANMDTARVAVQAGLLDPEATARDAQDIIQSLSSVADVLGEDIPRVTRSAQQLLRTGLAKDAQQAFDIIVKGQQAGLNVSEDWLDTLDEYSIQWQKLGLEGGDVLGLLSQGVQAGARDTDIAADALKELSIRAVDGSKLTAEGFDAIGRNADEMSARFAAGGESASEALGDTLDGLREIEDPIKRDAAAVALFGTQAEDLGAALFAMDLDTAASQFDDLDGAASRALDTLGDNTKGVLDGAVRNIDLASTQIKSSLATAFSPEIQEAATFVTENREQVVGFFFDAADAAVGFGVALAEGAASGTEALGDFGGSLGPLIDGVADLAVAVDQALPGDQESKAFREWADGAVENLADFDKSTERTADQIRTQLIDNALTPTQNKLNELRIPAEAAARLSDTTNRLAGDIGEVGYKADGSKLSMKLLNGEFDTSTEAGRLLDRQVQDVSGALKDQVRAAAESGEGQKQLRERVRDARQAFIDQTTALGLTKREAERLADKYGLIPKKVVTDINADTGSANKNVNDFHRNVNDLPNRVGVDIEARPRGFAGARAEVASIRTYVGVEIEARPRGFAGIGGLANGGVVDYYAAGGFSENHVAQIAPAGAWRVWAEPETGGEAYIPLAPSKRARSMEILEETAARMGARVVAQADGSVMSAPSYAGPATATFSDAQVRILADAMREGAAVGLAGHEAAQDRASRYARSR